MLLEVGGSRPKARPLDSGARLAAALSGTLGGLFGAGVFTAPVPLFSACVEVLICSSFPKGFCNYTLSWTLSRVSLAFRIVFFFFVFLWIEVENYLELPSGSPRKSDIGGKAARGQECSGWECPAVSHFLPFVARHARLRAEGLTGASSPPECVCMCACVFG